jgi:hypothetical protein
MDLILSKAKDLCATREILRSFHSLRMIAVLALVLPSLLNAQFQPWVRLSGHGIFLYTRADPVPGGRGLEEIRLTQPALMVHGGAFGNRVRLIGTLDLEGLTIPNGELTPGAWGEGFIDRRHPHTYLHELMLTGEEVLGRGPGGARVSLSIGKGFAPFGTDDPMSRPIIRYPVNHHLAQILERAVVIVGVRAGPVVMEAGLFNGDEPEKAGDWPSLSRLGDSWSGRLTVLPTRNLELQGSYARVHSPEHRLGSGTDQQKWSVAARWDGIINGARLYGLAEGVWTSEADGFLTLPGVLAEGAWSPGRSRLHYRFERTERPEEERTLDPFRSVRPHAENSIQGVTRWTIHTLGYGLRLTVPGSRITGTPFVEMSYGRMNKVGGGVFDIRSFYGRTSFWSVGAGVRVNLGSTMHRMGRYGVAEHGTTSDHPERHGLHAE